MHTKHRLQSTGFTLIEVLVVVVILSILAAVVVPKIISRPDTARVARVQLDLQNIQAALELYRLDNGQYPSQSQGLAALVRKPQSDPIPEHWHRYLAHMPKDPWGQTYHYQNPSSHDNDIDVYTLGANNQTEGIGINATRGNWSANTHESNA